MSAKKSQGAMANANGKVFEKMMIPVFEDNQFVVLSESAYLSNPSKYSTIDRYVLKNVKYTTIYEHEGKTEFVIVAGNRRIRVEAKYQSAAGSVDEKYPYMLLNGIYQYPEKEIIFVVDGKGYKPGAHKWLKEHIENNWLDYKNKYGKDIKLMNISEFMNWFNHEF
jgi:hypothetical protein